VSGQLTILNYRHNKCSFYSNTVSYNATAEVIGKTKISAKKLTGKSNNGSYGAVNLNFSIVNLLPCNLYISSLVPLNALGDLAVALFNVFTVALTLVINEITKISTILRNIL